jgi:hypothetical protein
MKNIFRNDRLFHLLIWLVIIIPKGIGSFGFIARANVGVYLTNLLLQNGVLLISFIRVSSEKIAIPWTEFSPHGAMFIRAKEY